MPNVNINKVVIGGRLTSMPDVRMTPDGGSVCSINLAVNRRRKGEDGRHMVDFFRVTAWGANAENAGRYLRTGSSVIVSGRLQTSEYVDKNKIKRKAVDVVAEELEFCDTKAEAEALAARLSAAQNPETQAEPQPEPDPVPDEDMPF